MTGLATHIEADSVQFDGIEQSNLMIVSNMSLGFLSKADNLNDYTRSKPHPTTEYFSDFDALGRSVESANIGHAKDIQEEVEFTRQEKEKDADQQQDALIAAIALFQDNLQPEDYELHNWHIDGKDWQVSKAGIEATLDRIENDLDGMAEEYNLDEDQANKLEDIKEEMKGKTEQEQQAILDRVAKEDPDVANAFMSDAKKRSIELKSARDHKVQVTPETAKTDEVFSTNNDGFDDFSSESVLAADFNLNAIGEIPEIESPVTNVTPTVNYGLA